MMNPAPPPLAPAAEDIPVLTVERVQTIAANLIREAMKNVVYEDDMQRMVASEVSALEQRLGQRLNQRFDEYRDTVNRNVDALEKYFRSTTETVTRQVSDLSTEFKTIAGRIEGALGAYTTVENTRLEEVRGIRASVKEVQDRNETTEDAVATINRQLFGDEKGGVPGLFKAIENLDRTTNELRTEVAELKNAQKKAAERWQSVRSFAKWAADVKLWKIILAFAVGGGSIGTIAGVVAEVLRAMGGG